MKIAFLRHGHALDVFSAKVSQDSQRPLSEIGKKEVEASAIKLRELGFKPSLIISSPYKRAIETSMVAGSQLNCSLIKTLQDLTEADADKTLNAIFSLCDGQDALVVGHQPLIGIMASFCCAQESLSFPTSGFALIEFKDKKDFNGNLLAFGFGSKT